VFGSGRLGKNATTLSHVTPSDICPATGVEAGPARGCRAGRSCTSRGSDAGQRARPGKTFLESLAGAQVCAFASDLWQLNFKDGGC